MKKQKFFKNRRGVAFMWMLIVFTVLIILMSSIVYIARQDILETRTQEEKLQTYYIALAGIDLTYAALMDTENTPPVIDTVINNLKSNNTPITDIISIEINGQKKGEASITIDRIKKDEVNWIRIVSVGNLQGKSVKVKTTMRINEDNKNQIVREKLDR